MKTNKCADIIHPSFFCQENAFAPSSLTLSVQHGNSLYVSSPGQIQYEPPLTRTERSMKAADNCFSILLKALLPFRWVFSSYFLSALLVLTWRLSPQVHSHWPLGLRNLSYSVLYKCVHLRLTAYLAHDFVCPGAGASWRFCFLFPYSLVPASLKSPRPFAANDLSREF